MFPNIQPESPLNLMVECGGSQTQNISTAGSSSDFAALPHTCWHGADLGDTTTSASIASDRGRVPCARTHLQPTPLVLGAALPFPREELRPRSCGRRAIVAALPGAVAGRRSASLPRAEPGRAPGLCGRGRLRPSGRAAAARGERSPAVCASCGRCSSPRLPPSPAQPGPAQPSPAQPSPARRTPACSPQRPARLGRPEPAMGKRAGLEEGAGAGGSPASALLGSWEAVPSPAQPRVEGEKLGVGRRFGGSFGRAGGAECGRCSPPGRPRSPPERQRTE